MSEAYEKICYLYRRWFQRTWVEPIPKDVITQFENFAENEEVSESRLRDFLMKIQKETEESASDTTKTAAKKCLKRWKTFSNKKGLDCRDFLHFLLSSQNSPISQQMQEEDLDSLLPFYFVHTSHHSYFSQSNLIQRKFMSLHPKLDIEDYQVSKTISGIIKALKRGVRVIELNLYPNYKNTNVKVCHEGTNSSTTISKCLKAIRDNAFEKSDFPVIIILVDMGLNPDLQAIVAAKLKDMLDWMLCCSDKPFNLPLRELKNKIILLSRRPKQDSRTPEQNEEESSKDYQKLIAGHIEDQDDEDMNLPDGEADEVRILRCTESVLENAKSSDIISLTQKNFLAVYPDPILTDGKTVFSSHDLFLGWTRGAQMVNSRAETYGKPESEKCLWIMQGMFRAYGNTGYVRKPDILLKKEYEFDPTVWRPVKKILQVTVCMGTGWHLDYSDNAFDKTSSPDFFATLEIVGVQEDEAREKTIPAMDQWIPKWDHKFEFPLTVPELAMLLIEVREFDPDRNHVFGGQTCLPVWLLKQGIRSVPLYNKLGKPLKSVRLLINIKIVTSIMEAI